MVLMPFVDQVVVMMLERGKKKRQMKRKSKIFVETENGCWRKKEILSF